MSNSCNENMLAGLPQSQADLVSTQARHVAGQAAMRDPRAAQLLALFEMSDERGKVILLAIAGIHAARYPREK